VFHPLICGECFKRRSTTKPFGGCLPDHEYLTIGDRDWRNLPIGVDKEVNCFSCFMDKFEEKYCSSPVDYPEFPAVPDLEITIE
jgi:hypothetical protein